MARLTTILLLAERNEYDVFQPVLSEHNRSLEILPLTSAADLEALDLARLASARLIAFATPVIVPAPILAALGHGGYNFHPGPPAYPGIAPAHFALYDGAVEFGTTLHVMTERVDEGIILDARLFPVAPGSTVSLLETQAYSALVRQFFDHARLLAGEAVPKTAHQSMAWGHRKSSRRLYRAMCDIPLDISRDDLERRMRAFGANHFGVVPTITIHGVRFRASPAEAGE